jgi:hypothetical protein
VFVWSSAGYAAALVTPSGDDGDPEALRHGLGYRLQMSVFPNVAGHAVAGAGVGSGVLSTSDCR